MNFLGKLIWPSKVQGEELKGGFKTLHHGGTSEEIHQSLVKLKSEIRMKDYDVSIYSLKDFADHLNKNGYDGDLAETIISINGWQRGEDGLTVCASKSQKLILDVETNSFQIWPVKSLDVA